MCYTLGMSVAMLVTVLFEMVHSTSSFGMLTFLYFLLRIKWNDSTSENRQGETSQRNDAKLF